MRFSYQKLKVEQFFFMNSVIFYIKKSKWYADSKIYLTIVRKKNALGKELEPKRVIKNICLA